MAIPSATSDESSSQPRRLPRSLLVVVGCVIAWFLLSEVVTEVWYRWRESQIPVTEPWAIDWPTEDDATARGFGGFSERELGDQEQELLRFNEARAANWRDSEGNQWTSFFLQWGRDKRLNNTDLAHNPTICLPAAGLELVKALPEVKVELGDQAMRFQSWEFRADTRPVYVFVAIRRWNESEDIDYSDNTNVKRTEKFEKVLGGNRSNPLETLQMIVAGPNSFEEASAVLEKQVRALEG